MLVAQPNVLYGMEINVYHVLQDQIIIQYRADVNFALQDLHTIHLKDNVFVLNKRLIYIKIMHV